MPAHCGGTGTIMGNVLNAGTVAPGNSIGTLSIAGNYMQAASGTYSVEVNGAGQSDLINVGGAARLQGGSVGVFAQPGSNFAPRTTYRILNAAGGLSGTFASVNELYPFLLSSLSYDANNIYLTLQIGGFAAAAQTPTQYAVGATLDAAAPNATGDFATVLGSLATLGTGQVLPFLTGISGQNYSGFSNTMVQGAQLFMNNFATQSGGGTGSRVALAEACDVVCDTTSPALWGAWGGALGGLGTVGAGLSTGAVTYNLGGFAAGLDRQMTPNLRAGVTVGYMTGTQWIGGFSGQGFSNTVQAGLYGNYSQGKAYLDGFASYAYSANQMSRAIVIPNLPTRTAQGQTGANQAFGQLEGGYRFELGGPVDVFVTPFARLQGYTGTQNAFNEFGAQSLSLERRRPDHQLAALGAGRPIRRRRRCGLARKADGAIPARLEPRICRHDAAGVGRPGRRADGSLHDLRRQPAARRRRRRRRRQHRRCRGDQPLSPLRGQHLRAGQRSCHHRRHAHDLVTELLARSRRHPGTHCGWHGEACAGSEGSERA